LAAADSFTVEVWTYRGLAAYDVPFVIERSARRVHIAGIRHNPNERWMMQVAKNLTDPLDGFLLDKRYLIMDRDTKYSEASRHLLEMSGVRPVRLPPKAPNLNAYVERFVRSINSERTNRLIFCRERSLRYAIGEYVERDNEERPHQGIANRSPVARNVEPHPARIVDCRERLGGLLRSYHRRAA
jgi:putative transposase